MNDDPWATLRLDPPLVACEVDFLASLAPDSSVRRVWPGQPASACPWRVTADGTRLELERDPSVADVTAVGDAVDGAQEAANATAWLRFLTTELLAPSTGAALSRALAEGLRGGHELNGVMRIGLDRQIRVDRNRISEWVLTLERRVPLKDYVPPFSDDATAADGESAVVLDLDARRRGRRTQDQAVVEA